MARKTWIYECKQCGKYYDLSNVYAAAKHGNNGTCKRDDGKPR